MKDLILQFKKMNQVKNTFQLERSSQCNFLQQRVTVWILIICLFLVSYQNYFGAPIVCKVDTIGDSPQLTEKFVNTYCFIMTTYTIIPDASVPAGSRLPGLGSNQGERIRHAYYQWVPYVLFIQLIIYMVPRFLWDGYENGLVTGMVAFLDEDVERQLVTGKKLDEVKQVAKYFSHRLGQNRGLGMAWVFTEILALAVVLLNIGICDLLLNGNFSTFALDLLRGRTQEGMFPMMTKCNINLYGSSGTIQCRDAICIMSLNVVHEKVYYILSAWFLLLVPISILSTLSTIVKIIILKKMGGSLWVNTVGISTHVPGQVIPRCAEAMEFADSLLFLFLASHMRPVTYRKFVHYLALSVERNDSLLSSIEV